MTADLYEDHMLPRAVLWRELQPDDADQSALRDEHDPWVRALSMGVLITVIAYSAGAALLLLYWSQTRERTGLDEVLLFLGDGSLFAQRQLFPTAPTSVSPDDIGMTGAAIFYVAVILALTGATLREKWKREGGLRGSLVFAYSLNANLLTFSFALPALHWLGKGPVTAFGALQDFCAALALYAIVVGREYLNEITKSRRFTENHFALLIDFGASLLLSAYLARLAGDVATGLVFGLALVAVRLIALLAFDLILQFGFATIAALSFTELMAFNFAESPRKRLRALLRAARVPYCTLVRRDTLERSVELVRAMAGRDVMMEAAVPLFGRVYWPASLFIVAWMCLLVPVVGALLYRWVFNVA